MLFSDRTKGYNRRFYTRVTSSRVLISPSLRGAGRFTHFGELTAVPCAQAQAGLEKAVAFARTCSSICHYVIGGIPRAAGKGDTRSDRSDIRSGSIERLEQCAAKWRQM